MTDPEKNKGSALNVMKGVDQPSQINEAMVKRLKGKKTKVHTPDEFIEGILAGNRTILSKAITLVESSLPAHQDKAKEIISRCIPHSGKSLRIGITGVPGVGKSTFIEALGKLLTSEGHKLAVLAIDPSSSRSKGSILGDKTRMEDLAVDPQAFIRPSPSAGSLGGVARKTRETIILCEAAGFDIIFVETVGVGQSETTVHGMVDFFLLLMLAGAGDELQGIKRGIIEMADAIFINKADGDNLQKAQMAKREYSNALHLFPPSESGWIPVVDVCSARTREGISAVWEAILRYHSFSVGNGYFMNKRMDQNRQVLFETIEEALRNHFFSGRDRSHRLREVEEAVISGRMNPYTASKELLDEYFKHNNQP